MTASSYIAVFIPARLSARGLRRLSDQRVSYTSKKMYIIAVSYGPTVAYRQIALDNL